MSSNEVRQFYQLVADEYHGLRDARGKAPVQYRDLWCPRCGMATSHRLEFRERAELRHCTRCKVTRTYAV